MTSTRVQRTLVKSAPEIWAELSDPAALARHLDPVGEIRITRAEPEQKVEWEADGASGTVLIKPSGWGTRVTLIMSREEGERVEDAARARPPGAAATAGEPAGASQPEVRGQPGGEPGSEAVLEAAGAPKPTVVSKPEVASKPEVVSKPKVLAEPKALAEPEGEPAPEAASGAEGSAPQPADVSDAADEAAGQDSPAAQAADAGDGRSELQLASTPPPHGLDLLPRRGLLARLLGRRRRAATQALGGGDSFEPRAVRSTGLRPWPTASAEWVHQFPRREPDSEIAPARAEPEPSVEDMLGEHDAPAEAAPATADDPVLRGEEPPIGAHAKGRPGDGTDHVVEPQARGQGEHHSGPGEQSAGGAGHEAGSAEQDAGSSEQDAAVLSAVLDRLGAAHHRPFSRA